MTAKAAAVSNSSTWRAALVAALLMWAPGAVLLTWHHRELARQILETAAEELEQASGEQLWEASEVELGSERLVDVMLESATLDRSQLCLRLESAGGDVVFASFGELSATPVLDGRFTVMRMIDREIEDSEAAAGWCLVQRRNLADGRRLFVGQRIDARYRLIRRGEIVRNLLWMLGLPLACTLAWWQSRPIARFLEALSAVAQRQATGDVRARLPAVPAGRDLSGAVATVNQMLKQLEKTVLGLSLVSDSIAHDLRTPLSRLQAQLERLKRSSEPSEALVEAVQDEADTLLATFKTLLRIAQAESGGRRHGLRAVDMAEIVHQVAELYAPVFAEKDVEWSLVAPRQRVEYRGDRDLWMQALSNLVENALKYTPAGGRVRCELEVGGRRPRIRLTDSGPGIPESEREKVFGRFYRLQRHRGERGSGLGLSLVSAVCEMHEAEIRLGGEDGLVVEIDL